MTADANPDAPRRCRTTFGLGPQSGRKSATTGRRRLARITDRLRVLDPVRDRLAEMKAASRRCS